MCGDVVCGDERGSESLGGEGGGQRLDLAMWTVYQSHRIM